MLRFARFFLGLALTLTVVLVVMPIDPAVATSITTSLDQTPHAVTAQTPEELGDDLTATQVEALALPDEGGEVDPAEMPEGDFSSLLESAEATLAPEVLEPTPIGSSQDDLASEVADLPVVDRDEYSKTYEREDGSFIQETSVQPMHVAVDGEWTDISTDIEVVTRAEEWRVEGHPLDPEFALEADGTSEVTVTRDGEEVQFGLTDTLPAEGEVSSSDGTDEDILTFPSVAPGASLEYQVEPGGVKETLILESAPDLAVWSWQLDSQDLTPQLAEYDVVNLVDDDGNVVMHIPTPIVWDSSGEEGKSDNALINAAVSIQETAPRTWSYTVDGAH